MKIQLPIVPRLLSRCVRPIAQPMSRPRNVHRKMLIGSALCLTLLLPTLGGAQTATDNIIQQQMEQRRLHDERVQQQLAESARRAEAAREEARRRNQEQQERIAESTRRRIDSINQTTQSLHDNVSTIQQAIIDRNNRQQEEYNARRELREQKRLDAEQVAAAETSSPSGRASEVERTPSGEVESTTTLTGYPGEKYPQTRLRAIGDAEARSMSLVQLRYAIKEALARHGADFSGNEDFRRQFDKFNWYRPREGASIEEIKADLSDLERSNLEILKTYRELKKAEQ